MVMAQSLFIELKQHYPGLQIDLLAPPWSLELLQAMPQISAGHALETAHGEIGLKKRYRLARRLRSAAYDWAIVLPNSWKSALVPWWAGIPNRTGYRGEMRYGLLNDLRLLDKQALGKTVERFVALGRLPHPQRVEHYPLPKLLLQSQQLQQVCAKFAIEPGDKLLALSPGAEYGPAKRWPERHFAKVAEKALSSGWRVLLLGSVKDTAVTRRISELAGEKGCIDLAGRTTLVEVVALLQRSTAAVSNDSGLMHIAAAVDTRLIAIYGSSDPAFTPPLNPCAKILYRRLACSPCFQRQCPLGHLDCLAGIEPQQVISSLGLQ